MRYDYLLVGQGLAGSLLAHFLIKRHHKVLIFDNPKQPQASAAAAGIFNPFTGRKLVKTWMADKLFPFLLDYYQQLEKELGTKLLYQKPMYRPFTSIDEQNDWDARSSDERYGPYIEEIFHHGKAFPQVVNPLGGLMLKKCGYVDIVSVVAEIRNFLRGHCAFKAGSFNASALQVLTDHVKYRDVVADKIIFCDGPWLNENSYFDWLPLTPVKGELLEVVLEEPLDMIVNRGVFVLPIRDGRCKIGATFDNQVLDWHVTEVARDRLKKGADKLLRIKFKVIKQLAGIRPASLDRRPLIGLHPEYEPLAIFNGLGTKGVSLAPYLIQQFYEFLERGKPLIPDVTISRYFSLYYNKI